MRAKIAIPMTLSALVAASVGVLAAVLLIPTPTPSGLQEAREPQVVQATSEAFSDERQVDVSFQTSTEQTLTARVSGTVTATSCQPGEHVNTPVP